METPTARPGEGDERTREVWAALDQVVDPELGLPITDLGLVYGVDVGDGAVTVEMTTTTPVCPLGSYLAQVAETTVAGIPWVEQATVRVVDEPPWSPELMSDRARAVLGIR